MRMIPALFVLLFLFQPASWSGDSARGQRLKIGLCMANLDAFLGSVADAAVQRAAEKGLDLVLLDAQDDDANQLQQVHILLDERVDALVLNPTSTASSGRVVDAAAQLGVPVVWVNKNPFAGRSIPQGNYVIVSDNIREGELGMECAGGALGGKGGIVLLRGTPGHEAAEGRTAGAMRVLRERFPELRVLAEEHGNWSRERGAEIMRRFVSTHGDAIRGVVSNNDEMALGAVHVLRAAGMDGVVVCSVDGTRDGIASVESGKGITATAYQDPYAQGSGAIDLAVKAAAGEEANSLTTIPAEMVTRENVREFKRRLQRR